MANRADFCRFVQTNNKKKDENKMKRVLLGLAAIFAASTSYGFDTWYGMTEYVDTELYNETGSGGRWYVMDDAVDGGKSDIIWPTALGNEYSSTAVMPVLELCDGLCGTAMLEKGFEYPYVMLAFNVVGFTSDTDTTSAAANASEWDGLCITYRSTAYTTLQLGLGEKVDKEMAYANPYVVLPKTNIDTSLKFRWEEFKQPSWFEQGFSYGKFLHIGGEDAAKQLVSVRFRMQDVVGAYDFNICAIGPYDGNCPDHCTELVYPRWFSHDSISIADIPDQPFTGDSICPEIVITDHHKFKSENAEDRLVLGSDYTVKCEDNVNVGTARMTIFANNKDYYGVVVKNFKIVVDEQHYGALTVYKDQYGPWAVIDGEYDGVDTVKVENEIKVNHARFDRKFVPDAYSTLILPFDISTDSIVGLMEVLKFAGVTQESETSPKKVEMNELWSYNTSSKAEILKANTPYIIKTYLADLTFKGPVTIAKTVKTPNADYAGSWEFRGVYSYKVWNEDDPELGVAYGFAAAEKDEYKVGDFVKVGTGAYINPMRAYMIYYGDVPAPLKPAQIESLPESMDVVVVDESGEQTTVIGTLNTRTGEFRMNKKNRSFDLNGRKIHGNANAKGAYYGKP